MNAPATFDRAEWLEFPLSRGGVALIDLTDLPIVAGRNWYVHTNGYASTEVRGNGRRQRLYMHRVILDLGPGLEADHRNRDRLDNRRSNLRSATRRQQNGNQGKRSDNTSGYRGVSVSKAGWQAHIRVNGKSVSLGATWPTARLAAEAYDRAALDVFGEFATLNFPTAAAA